MGISHVTYPLIDGIIKSLKASNPSMIINILELGNQHLRDNFIPGKKAQVAKKWFESLGCYHVSIDLNGKDEAQQKDLSKPIETVYGVPQQFDIVTNFGTTEHVKNQYHAFKNIHNFTIRNGIMLHTVPEIRSWPRHCYFWYTERFFMQLARICKYEILMLQVRKRGKNKKLVCAIMKKNIRSIFPTEKEFKIILNLYCEAK